MLYDRKAKILEEWSVCPGAAAEIRSRMVMALLAS